jgi:peptidoglycan/LPS O-acetylase OafA/YrhL
MQHSPVRPELDGVRALAVLLVVAYHYGFVGFSGGYVGVDVFFVLSGYLISSQILARPLTRSGLVDFYARRCRRILPLASLTLVATSLAVWFLLGTARLDTLAKDIMLSATFLGNVAAASGGEYLSGVQLPSPVRHFWSLAVEEQFYLLWPVMIMAGFTLFPSRSRLLVLRWLSAAVVLLSFVASALLTSDSPTWSYYLPHTRIWALAAGAFVATVSFRRGYLAPAALLALAGSLLLIGTDTVYPGVHAALPVLASVGLLLIPGESTWARLLGVAPLRYVGRLSFSLYLWHWPALVVLEERFGYLNISKKALLLLAVVVLSSATFHWFENPIRYARRLHVRPGNSLAVLPVALLAAVAVPLFISSSPMSTKPGPTAASLVEPAPPMAKPLVSAPASSESSDQATTSATPAQNHSSVLLLGDSTLAPLRWFVGADASLSGFTYVLDAESCRKLANRGCEGREGRIPPSFVSTLDKATVADILVVMGGYHSHPSMILKEFRATVDAAREAGFKRILWLSWRESTAFPGVKGAASMYQNFNDTISAELRSGEYEDVVWADWATYSAQARAWFTDDGIHVNLLGALGLGEYLSRYLAHLDARPCPGQDEGICPAPRRADPVEDLITRYGLTDTIEHCYEMGEQRTPRCKPDRLQVDQ